MTKRESITKKGTKRFTGCWTCRRRGVKCDEERPSCKNCKAYGVECEGYMVKLCWGDNKRNPLKRTPEKNRSLILYEWKENQLLDDLQIDYFLDRIDMASVFITAKSFQSKDDFSYGPFNVFDASCSFQNARQFPEYESDSHGEIVPTSYSSPQGFFLGPESRIRERLEQASFVGLQHDLEIEVILLDFWDTYLHRILTPLDETEVNPYNLMLKEALDSSRSAEIQRALLHTVCAMCSSFLSTGAGLSFIAPEYQGVDYRQYWNFHKIRGLNFVSASYAWKEAATSEEVSFLVASIYFLLATDVLSNSDEWQIHFRGAVEALKTISDSGEGGLVPALEDQESVPGALLFFAQMTKLTYLFSTLYNVSDDVCNRHMTVSDLEFIRYPEENMAQSLMYRNTGITPGMLTCLSNIVNYLQVADFSKARDSTVMAIEQELAECEPPPFNNNMSSLNPLIVYHQAVMFHIAMRLLFMREVKLQDPDELQVLVDSGIDHIEINEEITKDIPGFGLFWPSFVICCEATSSEGQARVSSWLQTIEPHCVDSMKRGKRVIKKVWERRRNGDQVSWLSVIRELDPTLLLA
ncbi:unnamed protein product [Kuraishia capsulata CBS 1993]|uniref:Zn(2)-C6 fungal-type domain-containing protein n=1 Tax=Kuraishia capsulata CBS 1993 TaxID=1382522 RepID=W6MF05_9ASCO|nr:uncharacterized protein KUCA_T00000009001 [Kuraishia capsulata CBS 1993]CDK24049.1 unnamed protein product [Kuraishia capsulata CBS 1993]